MIPSRGLRWSSQSISLGRWRLGQLSTRHFSSSTCLKGPLRSTSIPSQAGALGRRIPTRPHPLRAPYIIQRFAAVRFQSTSPLASDIPPTPTSDTLSSTASASTPERASGGSSFSLDDAIDLSTSNIHNIPEQIGYLKSLGLDYGWGPTSLMEWTLEHVHVLSGTPWWASIALTAILVRVVLFYPYIAAADNAAKLATVSPITKPLYAKMTAASRAGDTAETMRLRGELKLIQKRAGISLGKSMIPLLQVPLGYGTFFLLRGMAKLPVPGLETGGVLWFTNLAVPDPYWLLPMGTAGILHWVLRKGGETGVNTLSPGAVRALSYGFPALTLAFTWWLPAGLQLSFFISGILSFTQARLFRWKPFRNFLNMTPMPKTPDPFTIAQEAAPSPYQSRIIIAQRNATNNAGSYEPPRGASSTPSGFPTPPVKPTLLSGLKKEVESTISSVKSSARETMKSAREYAGQERKGGKKTKREKQAAEAYEKKRAAEEQRKLDEMDLERRARRERRAREREREGG